jgi:adenylate cyclase
MLEIERKFLLTETPSRLIAEGKLKVHMERRIEQTYLALDSDQEFRVRKLTDLATGEVSFTHTFKQGNGISREEFEVDISESIYGQFVRAFGAVPLTKNRITADWEGITVEIDTYDQLALAVAEVEFASEADAHAFVAPDWFGKDISSERQYSNKTVWKQLQERH